MVKEIVSLTVASKAIKHLETNLTKETNNKTLMKEIEEDTNKWKDILWSWVGIISIAKIFIIPKAIYKIQGNSYQNSNGMFHINNLNICMESQIKK